MIEPTIVCPDCKTVAELAEYNDFGPFVDLKCKCAHDQFFHITAEEKERTNEKENCDLDFDHPDGIRA